MSKALNLKQKVLALVMAVMLFIGLATPQTASANGDLSGLDIKITDTGALTMKGGGMEQTTGATAWNSFLAKYKNFIVGISGVGAVTMILFFIMQLLKLGGTAGNPQERSKVLAGLVWSGVAAAGLGIVSVLVGFFYNALK